MPPYSNCYHNYRSYKNPLDEAPLRTVTARGNDPTECLNAEKLKKQNTVDTTTDITKQLFWLHPPHTTLPPVAFYKGLGFRVYAKLRENPSWWFAEEPLNPKHLTLNPTCLSLHIWYISSLQHPYISYSYIVLFTRH